MKKLLVMVILVLLALYWIRHSSKNRESQADATVQAVPAPDRSNYFKRPLDRTHEVIDQVKKQRNEAGRD